MNNKDIVCQYVEAFNAGDMERLRALFTEDAVIQGVLGWGTLDVIEPIWRMLHESLAAEMHIEALVAEGDLVAARYTERGTWRAPLRRQEPTGKSYELVAMEFFEMRGGRIARRWGARDAASQARQIGLPLQ
jgi:steroid delta-isomerase-like uncharacterized protein